MKYAPLNLPAFLSYLCKLYEYSADQMHPWVMPGTILPILMQLMVKFLHNNVHNKNGSESKNFNSSIFNYNMDLSGNAYAGRKECMKILEMISVHIVSITVNLQTPPTVAMN
jgi:hypothetical protein